MEKFLLFTTGGGTADPLNWDSSEAVVHSIKDFKGMKPGNSRSIDLFFETQSGKEVVTLGIKNGTHSKIMQAISNAIVNSSQGIIAIADVDSNRFINTNIHSVTINTNETYAQKLTTNAKEKIAVGRRDWSSCLITNTHLGTVTITLDLYLTSQVGTDITSTTVLAAEAEAVSTSSVTLTVDTVAATADAFLNERVYNSRGTFLGVCTAVNSGTEIVFAGGLEAAIQNNFVLFTGTRYNLLKSVSIPVGPTLKLEGNEISFDKSVYDLYAVSNNASGLLTFVFHY